LSGSRANHPSSSNFFLSVAKFASALPGLVSIVWFGLRTIDGAAISRPPSSSSSSSSSSGPSHRGSIASRRAARSSPFGPYECNA
jgi:hypothetical protein